ncbi:9374_t:CDS:2 [Paraglomus brasilianum]|uniref:9374_t:CDS:1 n=1 Tax=Paraglomus brasilianum TaxID=144538 RepID=A0A9N9AK59_9GLOM|nr:9374_t:CDS:2 [Paraglomus brasilianum]
MSPEKDNRIRPDIETLQPEERMDPCGCHQAGAHRTHCLDMSVK